MTDSAHPTEALRPHALLTDYYDDEADRRRFIRQIFDETASDYDRIEAVLAFGSGRWYRREALKRAGLAPGMQMLDVGMGTGLVAREALSLIGPRGHLTGVDPSPGMMSQAADLGIAMVQGFAEKMPIGDGAADFLSMGYALRHIADVSAAFSEFHRVLRPGGRLVILEITRPASRVGSALLKTYMRTLVPTIARVVARQRHDTAHLWRYYWDTIEACIRPEAVMSALRDAGFRDVRHEVALGIFSEYTAVRP